MAVKEISRRLIGGIWETGVADEGGGNGGSMVQSVAFSYTAAEFKASNSRLLLPAPGDGKFYLPVAWHVLYTFVTTDYSDGNIYFSIGQSNFTFGQNAVLNLGHDNLALGNGLPLEIAPQFMLNLPLYFETIFADPPNDPGDGLVSGRFNYIVDSIV